MATDPSVKRSLILAGGGLKVAFQAGVLEVWLDEANIEFHHADGASGGVFNLAMWAQGMSGRQIADNWRNLDPTLGLDLHWGQYLRLPYAESFFEYGAFRRNVFPRWGLDWDAIRASSREATFNVYNFTDHELEVLTPDQMTEDLLIAGVSLPMWFPPVVIDGRRYIDPVYVLDANLEEAIRRGAGELWVIWTVSERGEWNDGFVAQYFQIIESAANGQLRRVLRRIEANNQAVAQGGHGEFGRRVEVKMLKAEVAVHYLLNLTRDRLAEAVNQGVLQAREWCQKNGIELGKAGPDYPSDVHRAQTRLSFTEEMKGYVSLGETDYERGYRRGADEKNYLMFHLTIEVDGVNRFVTDPRHEARAHGWISCEQFGGQREVSEGIFNLFVDQDDPSSKRMLYRLFFEDGAGNPLTLSGHKVIRDDPGFDLWSDTTTLYVHILKGHVGAAEEQDATIVASGILRILLRDFLKQLATFRTEGPSLADRGAAMGRFGRLFLGKLWDVYATEVLAWSPF